MPKERICECCSGSGTVPFNKKGIKLGRYYWSIVVKVICIYTGYDKEFMHVFLKKEFNLDVKTDENGNDILYDSSTSESNNKEFIEYITKIRQYFLDEFDCYIPVPDELTEAIIQEIKHNYQQMFL